MHLADALSGGQYLDVQTHFGNERLPQYYEGRSIEEEDEAGYRAD